MSEPTHDAAIEPRANEAPDVEAVNAYLRAQAPTLGTVEKVLQFPGGYSNLTFLLNGAGKSYVLRRPPIGANIKSAHDMGREFTVLSKLKPHYPLVPTPFLYCEDESVIGAPFYLMEHLQGTILRAGKVTASDYSEQQFRTLSEKLIDNLARIHRIDIHKTGLIELGKPESYVQRQVTGWIERYYRAETDTISDMNELAGWLNTEMVLGNEATLLHNDYKYDNVIFDSNNTIIGVLDWEMATVGDPLMDLGAMLAYWSEPKDDAVLQSFNLTSLPGNYTRKEIVERYAALTQRKVKSIQFYYVFGLFKNAVIAQQIYGRWKKGMTTDPRFGELLGVIKSLARQGINTLMNNEL